VRSFGSSGSGDGQFRSPFGVAVDGLGNVFVSDSISLNKQVDEFTSAGVFVTAFGSFGSGDGQLDSAGLLAVDGLGNVFVPDNFNNRVLVFAPAAAVPEPSSLAMAAPGLAAVASMRAARRFGPTAR